MRDTINMLTGAGGVGAIELVQQSPMPSSGDTSEIIKVVIQLIISIATIFSLFKQKKSTNN